MVFCPFLQKRGDCQKESRCDFCDDSTYQSTINHQPHNISPRRPVQLYQQHKVPPVSQIQLPPFFGNRQQNNIMASLNRLEMRLQNIEYAQTFYPPLFLPPTAAPYVSALPVSVSKSFNGILSLSSPIPCYS